MDSVSLLTHKHQYDVSLVVQHCSATILKLDMELPAQIGDGALLALRGSYEVESHVAPIVG